jgi:heterodisulfide reductase subunit C
MAIELTIDAKSFRDKISILSGEDVSTCYQCGECSASCPYASEMDLLPSTVIRLIQLGQKELINSQSIWLCSTCLHCFARCPQGIDIAKVMEVLRQLNIRKQKYNIDLSKISSEDLIRLPQVALIASLRKLMG